jgi:gliding motility-associated-like protein
MKRILIGLACLLCFPAAASHIVGGEFELLHVSGNQYMLRLIWYFDFVNNPGRLPEQQERNIEVYIFGKSDDQLVRAVTLAFESKERVGYTQPACSSGEIITDRLVYSAIVSLTPQFFGDPAGYYISWERCCRNYFINNIQSKAPGQGETAGQTFYLEFPAVVRNGEPFINSSPRLFPPLNDYACPNKPYYVDFAGIDDDGDSLVYSLVTPLNTHNAVPSPGAIPRPYPDVSWVPGFGLDRIVNGSPIRSSNPDLRISPRGFLRLTPRNLGLFAFAVKIDEFRAGVKIGESRRDFQLLVTDCRISEPPNIVGKKLADTRFGTAGNMAVSFENSITDDERCIIVSVNDPDAAREADGFSEFIRLKAVPLNFSGKALPELLPAVSTATIHQLDSVQFRICFPRCPYFVGGAYQVGIIAFDDACALPLSDTLKVAVSVEPPPNEPVEFVTGNANAVVNEGDQVAWNFEARDVDADELLLSFTTNGFVLSTAGMRIKQTSNANGVLKGTFEWDAYCTIYDFTSRTSFQVTLLVDDNDPCDLNEPATMTFDLAVILPGSANPVVDTGLTSNLQETEVAVERRIFQSLSFEVTGNDVVDNDTVALQMAGVGFAPAQYGMSFQQATGVGQVSSLFTWDITCDKPGTPARDQFELLFTAVDNKNKCRVPKTDTVHVFVSVQNPLNHPPTIAITSLNPNIPYSDGELHIVIGEPIRLSFTVRDTDAAPPDELTVALVAAEGTSSLDGFIFTPARGGSPQTAILEWSPDCSIFDSEELSEDYTFKFSYADNRCRTAAVDTVEVDVYIRDAPTTHFEAEPPNVFTPNGDSFNDYFTMERQLGDQIVNLLPPDNCLGQFQNVRIYDRWGKSVFETTDRYFKWDGAGELAGVYYYFVSYTNREYKGTLSLRR